MTNKAPFAVPLYWRLAFHAGLVVLSLAVLVPLAVVLGAAFKPSSEMFSMRPWPLEPTFDNFRAVLFETPFATYAWNSIATTVLRVVGQLVIALLAAYAFARWEFPGRNLLFALVLGAMLIPHQLTVVPTYVLIARLGWFDTWAALIVPNLATPFGAFLIRQHLLSIPKSLFEAAALDGAGHFRILTAIALPMILPVMSALAVVLFLGVLERVFLAASGRSCAGIEDPAGWATSAARRGLFQLRRANGRRDSRQPAGPCAVCAAARAHHAGHGRHRGERLTYSSRASGFWNNGTDTLMTCRRISSGSETSNALPTRTRARSR